MITLYLVNRQSVIADDLTHNHTASLNKEELTAYLEEYMVTFLLPIAQCRRRHIGEKMYTMGKFHLPRPGQLDPSSSLVTSTK